MSFVFGSWEVEASKLSEELNSFSVVSPRCVDCVIEIPKVVSNSIALNASRIESLVVEGPLVSAGIVGLLRAVGNVVRTSCFAKITSSVVKSVSILMVNIVLCFKNCAMHQNRSPVLMPDSDETVPFFDEHGTPVPLVEPLVIRSAYESILFFGKRDNSVGWIKRLNNSMVLHVALHGLSVKEIAQRSAALLNFISEASYELP